ncbi:hypothetical protein ACFY2W_34015 [Streptomyces sp. NPDC001262]|uniref:hypothetical protein n=1 Tax=Streptomyces sp. NPDC001262 TaxID=3364552 RepID=UPI0036A64F4C
MTSSSRVRSRTAARTWGGIDALCGAFTHESGRLEARERQIEKTVGAVVLGEVLTEVGQHAVVEAWIVQLYAIAYLKSMRQRTASAA